MKPINLRWNAVLLFMITFSISWATFVYDKAHTSLVLKWKSSNLFLYWTLFSTIRGGSVWVDVSLSFVDFLYHERFNIFFKFPRQRCRYKFLCSCTPFRYSLTDNVKMFLHISHYEVSNFFESLHISLHAYRFCTRKASCWSPSIKNTHCEK